MFGVLSGFPFNEYCTLDIYWKTNSRDGDFKVFASRTTGQEWYLVYLCIGHHL
jgi:hypothetical protein